MIWDQNSARSPHRLNLPVRRRPRKRRRALRPRRSSSTRSWPTFFPTSQGRLQSIPTAWQERRRRSSRWCQTSRGRCFMKATFPRIHLYCKRSASRLALAISSWKTLTRYCNISTSYWTRSRNCRAGCGRSGQKRIRSARATSPSSSAQRISSQG